MHFDNKVVVRTDIPTHAASGILRTLLWSNGWMDEDATWYRSRPPRRPHCIRQVPMAPRKGHSTPLPFRPVYCGHGRPSQLLLSSCSIILALIVNIHFFLKSAFSCLYILLTFLFSKSKLASWESKEQSKPA